jgi:hypothetical protein
LRQRERALLHRAFTIDVVQLDLDACELRADVEVAVDRDEELRGRHAALAGASAHEQRG